MLDWGQVQDVIISGVIIPDVIIPVHILSMYKVDNVNWDDDTATRRDELG